MKTKALQEGIPRTKVFHQQDRYGLNKILGTLAKELKEKKARDWALTKPTKEYGRDKTLYSFLPSNRLSLQMNWSWKIVKV